MKKKSDQAGFSVIEVVLVLIILCAVGGVGYYVYHANANATDIYNAASDSSSTPVIKAKKAANPAESSTGTSPSSSTMQSSADDRDTLQDANANTLKDSDATL